MRTNVSTGNTQTCTTSSPCQHLPKCTPAMIPAKMENLATFMFSTSSQCRRVQKSNYNDLLKLFSVYPFCGRWPTKLTPGPRHYEMINKGAKLTERCIWMTKVRPLWPYVVNMLFISVFIQVIWKISKDLPTVPLSQRCDIVIMET